MSAWCMSSMTSADVIDSAKKPEITSNIRWGMTFEKPIPHVVGEDPLINTSQFRGKIVYTFAIYKKDVPSYLVVKDLRVKSEQAIPVQSYLVHRIIDEQEENSKFYIAFDPKFSPNGRFILFKYGNPYEETGSYHLYILDTSNNDLVLATSKSLSYPDILWSPDGQYIAYVEGGDTKGNIFRTIFDEETYLGPLTLHILDWRTGKDSVVVANDTIKHSFSWAAPHTLYVGFMDGESQQKLSGYRKARTQANRTGTSVEVDMLKAAALARPNVYQYNPDNNRLSLVIKNAYRPLPSPNRELIAFYASEPSALAFPLPPNWMENASHMSLSVKEFSNAERTALRQQTGRYSQLIWGTGSNRLFSLTQIQPSPKARATVVSWDIAKSKSKLIATIEANDFKPLADTLRFFLEPFLYEKTMIMIRSGEALGKKDDNPSEFKTINRLQGIDTATEKQVDLIKFNGNVDFDISTSENR